MRRHGSVRDLVSTFVANTRITPSRVIAIASLLLCASTTRGQSSSPDRPEGLVDGQANLVRSLNAHLKNLDDSGSFPSCPTRASINQNGLATCVI